MELLITVLIFIFIVAGLIGCIIPMIPGPPLSLIGYYLTFLLPDVVTPEWYYILFWTVLMVGITILDNLLPALGAKKLGGTKYGMWGGVIGLFVGLTFFPIGLFVGPFIGAFIGEKIAGQKNHVAIKAGLGSSLGLIAGTFIKLVACIYLTIVTVQLTI
ncbi:DUF456 domain-containing protein [Halosquirtibacter laminarini]|uniref:DUF456 domain-containing protein n=1 Tax=Halosquirtibacter laminarini TaxID=3374600 RepID=A0AC61NGZ1_9BACT|nr:DUF456 domain-containing protein [Prolixibacteraceae bacterium]